MWSHPKPCDLTNGDSATPILVSNPVQHIVPLLILAVLFCVTTVPYLTRFPFSWDGGQFVLGVDYFSVPMHQPHPPGNPLLIGSGKLLSYYLSAHRSLQLMSVSFAAGAILCLYALVWQFWRNRWLAFFLALALLLDPLLWFCRETCLTYTVGAFAGTSTCLWVWLGNRGHPAFLYVGALALGLLGGFRPSLVLMLTPLLLVALVESRSWKRGLVATLILATACLLWMLPLVTQAEGLRASRELFSAAAHSASYLLGASFQANWIQLKRLLHTVLSALNVMLLPLVLSLTLVLRSSQLRRKSRIIPFAMIAAWIGPPALFFSLVHFGHDGYALVFLPAAYLLMGPCLLELGQRRASAKIVGTAGLVILAAFHGSLFVLLTPRLLDPRAIPTSRVERALQPLASAMPTLFSLNASVLRDSDRRVESYVQLARSYPPEGTVVIGGGNAAPAAYRREWRLAAGDLFRSLGAVLPEYRVFFVPAAGPGPKRVLTTLGWRSSYLEGTQTIPGSVRRVLFALDSVPGACALEGLRLETKTVAGRDCLVGEIEGDWFRYCGVLFQKEP